MHGDREDDVSLDRHAHSSIEIVFTRNENSVRCKQCEPYVSEKRKSVIKPEDFSFVKGFASTTGPNILYIIVVMFVISNGALERCPSSDNCVRVRAYVIVICTR